MGDLVLKVGHTTLAEAERKLILATVALCDGHKVRAAEKLGVTPKTVYNKMRDYEGKPRYPYR